jgi:NAD(P)-dependent dehydrogenase (short-subunit alcohol dehydrogenase family)
MELNGKVAIVTGGGNGIGRGIALELAERGADIVLGEIAVDAAAQVAQEIKAAGQDAIAVETDVTQQESTDSLVEAAIERFGTVDILVNNAGVGGAPGWWERAESSSEDWDAAFDVNVFGIVHCTKSVEGHMSSQKSGKIVNIASVAGRIGAGGIAHYSASKAAAINVSQAYAIRLAPSNINVNTVCPGLLWTDLWEKLAVRRKVIRPNEKTLSGRDVFLRRLAETTPMNREQTPQDIAKVTAFLVSDRARNITGQAINVTGGWVNN